MHREIDRNAKLKKIYQNFINTLLNHHKHF